MVGGVAVCVGKWANVSDFMERILTALVPGVAISVVTAWVTVKLSLRNFYSQRWWERKAEEYSKVLEALSDVKYVLGEWIREFQGRFKYAEEYSARLSERYRQAEDIVTQIAGIGELVISGDAAEALAKVSRALDTYTNGQFLYGDMENAYDAIGDAIPKIRECARRDLKLK